MDPQQYSADGSLSSSCSQKISASFTEQFTGTNENVFPFFKLPLELRNMIYRSYLQQVDEYLRLNWGSLQERSFSAIPRYKAYKPVIPLFFINEQLRAELLGVVVLCYKISIKVTQWRVACVALRKGFVPLNIPIESLKRCEAIKHINLEVYWHLMQDHLLCYLGKSKIRSKIPSHALVMSLVQNLQSTRHEIDNLHDLVDIACDKLSETNHMRTINITFPLGMEPVYAGWAVLFGVRQRPRSYYELLNLLRPLKKIRRANRHAMIILQAHGPLSSEELAIHQRDRGEKENRLQEQIEDMNCLLEIHRRHFLGERVMRCCVNHRCQNFREHKALEDQILDCIDDLEIESEDFGHMDCL